MVITFNVYIVPQMAQKIYLAKTTDVKKPKTCYTLHMENILLTLYPAAIFMLLIWGAKWHRSSHDVPADGFARDHLSKEQGKMIRGLACLAIILHHLTQRITSYGMMYKGPVTIFNYCGILFTAIFFFFSGYGLIFSVTTKDDYLQSFIKKRLPKVIIPFWTINAVTLLSDHFIYGIHHSLSEILRSITGLTLINSNGWYIIEIITIYLAFYIIFSLIKHKKTATVFLIIFTLILIDHSFSRGHDKTSWFCGEWWYNSTIAFAPGALYPLIRERIDPIIKKHWLQFFAIITILFTICFSLSIYAVDHFGYYNPLPLGKKYALITLILQSLACLLFVSLITVAAMKLSLKGKVKSYIGHISPELFLIHGYFLTRVFPPQRKLSTPVLFALVYICSIASASLLSPITGLLTQPRPLPKISLRKFLMAAIISFTAFILFSYFLLPVIDYRSECKALATAKKGDVICWGRFDTDGIFFTREKLKWIVLDKNENELYLICEKGIAGSSYNRKHEEVSWENSDLRKRLNSKEFTDSFSSEEQKHMIPANEDLISLLSPGEAALYFGADSDRELDITRAAESSGTNINRMTKVHGWDMRSYRSSWWWLRGDKTSVTAPIVTSDGSIEEDSKYVNKPGGAIRPVIRLKTELKSNERMTQ